MGTTLQRQRAALPVVLEALEALPVRALLALGGVLPANEVAVPANVTTVGFVQHERVLPYVDLVISHGGLSTISSALSFGKPLICIPQGREQPVNAAHLAACGAGLALPQDAGAEEIRSAVSTVLGSPTIRAAARAFTDPDAGERAADLVERLLEERARSGVRPLRRAEVPA
jgi:UDP:flavonoid glycosyltransferase YjiC (YdhE family)